MTKLAEVIEDKGLRKSFVANKAGIATSTMSNAIGGRFKPVNATKVKIALALQMEVSELFPANEDVPKPAEQKKAELTYAQRKDKDGVPTFEVNLYLEKEHTCTAYAPSVYTAIGMLVTTHKELFNIDCVVPQMPF